MIWILAERDKFMNPQQALEFGLIGKYKFCWLFFLIKSRYPMFYQIAIVNYGVYYASMIFLKQE